MKTLFVALIALHGLIHLMGPAKAFGLAELPQLQAPISRATGLAWLAAAVALLATAAMLALSSRSWWVVGLVAGVLSQAVIISSWGDAKVGTLVNLLLLAAVAYGFMADGPLGLRAEYRRDVESRLAEAGPAQAGPAQADAAPPPLTEADLAHLPDPVARYLRLAGVVGRPTARYVRTAWQGRIRAGPEDPWMEFTAEQYNFPGEPARFFLMDARRTAFGVGLPVDVYHAFRDESARMRVRLLSMIPLVDARGPEMTRAETVTLLNDMALLAPSTLADPNMGWEALDARSARAVYRVGTNEVSAVLEFNEGGELVDFVSDDRLAASPDGREFVQRRWSTPVGGYRSFGGLRRMGHGEGRWHTPEGSYAYIELELLEVEIDGGG